MIYTGTIESGVDFNLKYFNNLYVCLASGANSQRGLSQMMHRVRKIEDKIVHVYLNHLHKTECLPYTFEETQGYYMDLNKKYNENRIVYDYQTKQYTMEDYDSTLHKIMINNCMENINKNASYFMHVLEQMILAKRSTFEYAEEIEKKRNRC